MLILRILCYPYIFFLYPEVCYSSLRFRHFGLSPKKSFPSAETCVKQRLKISPENSQVGFEMREVKIGNMERIHKQKT